MLQIPPMTKTMWLSEGQHGKDYRVQQEGELVVGRDRNVKLGDLRVFWYNGQIMWDTPVIYVAERKHKSIIPFRAPIIWWRRIQIGDRLVELESFVNEIALAEWPSASAIKQRAKDISKEGFLAKLKGETYE